MIDGLHRLRHHAVVGGDDQDDDVGGLGAAGAHRGERLVAGRIDEGNHAARRLDLVGADVLRDAAGLAGHHVGLAQGIEQRRLAVVDVAHDGDDGSARGERIVAVFAAGKPLLDVGLGNALHRVAELLGEQLRGIGVDDVVDGVHLALTHQELDDVDGTLRHAVGEFLDGDGLRDDDLARTLLGRHLESLRLLLLALGAAAEGGKRAVLLLGVVEGVGNRELAAPALGIGLGAGRNELDLAPRLEAVLGSLVLGLRLGRRADFELARRLLAAALGLGFGTPAGLLLGLAAGGSFPLLAVPFLDLGTLQGILARLAALIRLAQARIVEGPFARLLLVVGQGAQDHARARHGRGLLLPPDFRTGGGTQIHRLRFTGLDLRGSRRGRRYACA